MTGIEAGTVAISFYLNPIFAGISLQKQTRNILILFPPTYDLIDFLSPGWAAFFFNEGGGIRSHGDVGNHPHRLALTLR